MIGSSFLLHSGPIIEKLKILEDIFQLITRLTNWQAERALNFWEKPIAVYVRGSVHKNERGKSLKKGQIHTFFILKKGQKMKNF